MSFHKLPRNSKAVLDALLNSDNPTEELCKRWTTSSGSEFLELQGIVRELRELNFINVKFADNKPYIVTLNNSARTYNERLAEYEADKLKQTPTYLVNHGITIGDGNSFSNSNIAGGNSSITTSADKKNFAERHPLLVSLIVGVISGFILMFSFWENIVNWIEAIF